MTIAKLDYRHKGPVSGEFRVRNPQKSETVNGSLYLTFTIEDCSGALNAYVWSEGIIDADELEEFDGIKLNGYLRSFNGGWIVDVVKAEFIQEEPDKPALLIPRSIAPLPSLLEELFIDSEDIIGPASKAFHSQCLPRYREAMAHSAIPLVVEWWKSRCTETGVSLPTFPNPA